MTEEFINTATLRFPMTAMQVNEELSTPGVIPSQWYVPAGYALVGPTPPPLLDPYHHKATATAVKVGETYVREWKVLPLSAQESQAAVSELRASRLSLLEVKRVHVEEGGIRLPNGAVVGTTIEDQNRITSIVTNSSLAGIEDFDFETANGWVTMTVTGLRQIAGVIALHVKECYRVKRMHAEALAALTSAEELLAYDVLAKWPERST